MTALPWGPVRERKPCTCRHAEASLGRLHGVSMGRGTVRIGTTPGCPEHDTCRGFTKGYRAEQPSWSNPWRPKHPKTPCPASSGVAQPHGPVPRVG